VASANHVLSWSFADKQKSAEGVKHVFLILKLYKLLLVIASCVREGLPRNHHLQDHSAEKSIRIRQSGVRTWKR
jgi:hypothetical protein